MPLEDYNPDGAYPEGYGYWGYGTSFHILFLSALQTIQLIDNQIDSGLIKTASYFQNMLGTSGKSFNYSDAGNGAGLNAAMFWFAYQSKNNSLLFNEKNYLDDASKMGGNRILPAAMIWGKDLKLDQIDVPTQKTWMGQGKSPVAMMRSSWTDKNAIYVGLKAGSAAVNHAHMDIGSFVMDAYGERWAMDLGMQEYESLESKGVKLWDKTQNGQRWEIMRYNNHYHNTLSFDNELQLVEKKATIIQNTTTPNFMSAVTDLSSIYENKIKEAKRGLAILDNDIVVIKDEITNNDKPTQMKWLMVTQADVKILNANTFQLTQNGKKMYLKVLANTKIELKTWNTDAVNSFDAPNPGTIRIGFLANLAASQKGDFTVLLSSNNKIVKVKPLNQWK